MEANEAAPERQPILIVGGGIGGMAFAIRAAEHGLPVEIVEIDPGWKVYGAGISITGPTYRALKRLGLLEQVCAKGHFITQGAAICGPDGQVISEVPMHPLEPGLPTAGGILRPELHAIMAGQVLAAGVPVRLGATVTDVTERADGVEVTFSSGDRRQYRAVVAADGAFSAMRERLFPQAPKPAYTGQFCWRLLADRPAQADRPHFFMGRELTCGVMPVSQDQMYLWLLENNRERRWLDEAQLAGELRAMLAPFGGPIMDAVRAAIDSGANIIARPLDAVLLPLPWHSGRTILIGDAAHATTPHLASGAGISIEDGLLLADGFARGGAIGDIYAAFEARRWERCRLVVEDSVAIGHMQQTAASPAELNQRMHRAQSALAQEI
ncbi:MAG TPA: FAD-dependent monooxygenase [Novosphingobium sp.]|nr:FAD-dependent monooxygenase [Novosphingobium sp.]